MLFVVPIFSTIFRQLSADTVGLVTLPEIAIVGQTYAEAAHEKTNRLPLCLVVTVGDR